MSIVQEQAIKALNRNDNTLRRKNLTESKVEHNSRKKLTESKQTKLTEAINTDFGRYEDFTDQLFDALEPLGNEGKKDWNEFFYKSNPYKFPSGHKDDDVDADEYRVDETGVKTAFTVIPYVEGNFGRAVDAAIALGIRYEITGNEVTLYFSPNKKVVRSPLNPYDDDNNGGNAGAVTECADKPINEAAGDIKVNEKNLAKLKAAVAELPVDPDLEFLEDLNEAWVNAPGMPVQQLPESDLINFFNSCIKADPSAPPQKFKVGYVVDCTPGLSPKYRGGKGSKDKTTDEWLFPQVIAIKLAEYYNVYNEKYADAKRTKDAFAAQGKDTATDVGKRVGFTHREDIGRGLCTRDTTGEIAFAALMDQNAKPRTRYYISVNGEPLHECLKADVAQYTNHPDQFMNPPVRQTDGAQNTKSLYLNGMYYIKCGETELGSSIF